MVKYCKPLVLCISCCHRAYCDTLRLGLVKAGWCTSRRVTMVAAAVATARVMASRTLWLAHACEKCKKDAFQPCDRGFSGRRRRPPKSTTSEFRRGVHDFFMVSYNPPKLFLHFFRQYLLAFTLAALEETKAQCDIFADNVVANQVSALDNSFPLRLSNHLRLR